jgi:hypothetical protein
MAGPDDEADAMYPNPYLAALRSARASAVGPAGSLAKALDAAQRAMEGNCWQSPTADAFYTALAGHRTTLKNCKERALQEFDDAIARQPETVPESSWQRHWHNLAPR